MHFEIIVVIWFVTWAWNGCWYVCALHVFGGDNVESRCHCSIPASLAESFPLIIKRFWVSLCAADAKRGRWWQDSFLILLKCSLQHPHPALQWNLCNFAFNGRVRLRFPVNIKLIIAFWLCQMIYITLFFTDSAIDIWAKSFWEAA